MPETSNQDAVINAIKSKLFKKLSYSNQDYESIILDLISVFKDSDTGLNTKWDNVSESDIMFIFMSLMAAHKDILNYMLDYRTLEGFMSTAKEITSVTRIANSFGFRIPGHKAARCEFSIASGLDVGKTITVEPFTSFVDNSNVSWTYVGDQVEIGPSDTLELFQGTPQAINNELISKFKNRTKSYVIGDRSIAIGNNYNAEGCSRLVVNGVEYEEKDNLYRYTDDEYAYYMLGVDPDGLTYVQLQRFVDLGVFDPSDTFTLQYIVTSGSKVQSASGIEKTFQVETVPTNIGFSPVDNSFYAGSNSLTKEEIKESFKSYYASSGTLVTLSDYKNYVLNIQKYVPNVAKCLAIDVQDDTANGVGDNSGDIPSLSVAIYVIKEGNEMLTVDEEAELLQSIDENNVSVVTPFINDADGAATNPLTLVDLDIALNTPASVSASDVTAIRDIVYNYVMGKGIGETLSASGINKELALYGYDYFYGDITINDGGGAVSTITAEYYQCFNIADKEANIAITTG